MALWGSSVRSRSAPPVVYSLALWAFLRSSQVCSFKKRDSFSFLLYRIFLCATSKFFVKFAIS